MLAPAQTGLSEASGLAAYGLASVPARPAPELGPYVRFPGVHQAAVEWRTATPQPSIVEFGQQASLGLRVAYPEATTNHSVLLSGLKPKTRYYYVVRLMTDAGEQAGDLSGFETDFNYRVAPWAPARSPFPDEPASEFYGRLAEALLEQTGITKGYALDYGCGNGRLAYELARRSDLTVMAVTEDAAAAAEARQALQQAGGYGTRLTVHHRSLDRLPYTKDWFNLIVASDLLAGEPVGGVATELLRVLRPSGGVAMLGLPAGVEGTIQRWASLDRWAAGVPTNAATIRRDPNRLVHITKGPLANIGEWSHNYGDAGQTASSHDRRITAQGMRLQWFGDPGPRGFTDRQARNPAPLAANGLLYLQGNNRLSAQDAYNGRIYWSLEVTGLRRVNLPRDGGNMCADETSLYVAVRDRLWRLAGYTGRLVQDYAVPTGPALDWGYVASAGDRLYGSSVKRGGFYTLFDGSWDYWYDSTSSPGEIAKICSVDLFCLGKTDGRLLWRYTNGVIINTTLAIGGGRVYFVDSRNPVLAAQATGRISSSALWQQNNLVALDAATGQVLWEQPFPAPVSPSPIVLFLCYADERLVLVDSTSRYYVFAFSATDGSRLWSRSHAWRRDHHGAHMYHPVIVQNLVIVEPYAYDSRDGHVVRSDLPERGGCSTMSAAGQVVHYIDWDYTKGSPFLWDVTTDQRVELAGTRSSCWLSVISAGGMVFLPPASAGCACRFPIQSTIALTAP
jgi:outer membrane protein assembly factor BamB